MLLSQSGKRFLSPKWEVLRDRNDLIAYSMEVNDKKPELSIMVLECTSSFVIPKDKRIACVDADKIQLPLVIRKWEKGDKFVPFGMTGKKKLSDYMTDKKFTLHQKENQYVVCCGEEIVWLVNERSDNRFRITDKTERVLLLQIKDGV